MRPKLGWVLAASTCVSACIGACQNGSCPACDAGTRCASVGVDTPIFICCDAPGETATPASAAQCCVPPATDAGVCACLGAFSRVKCASDSDCCSGRCGADAGWFGCMCGAAGSACGGPLSDCCSGVCDGGTCACIPTASAPAVSCTRDPDCCVGSCIGAPAGHCCFGSGALCSANADCCSGTCLSHSCS